MAGNSITEDIKQTGWAIRDWLGPYYMLGGAVAFGIAMLTLLDPSGQLARGVGAALLLVTIVAWAYFFVRRQSRAAEASTESAPSAKLHGILLAVTLFFMCGIFLSETFMRSRRMEDGAVLPPVVTTGTESATAATPTAAGSTTPPAGGAARPESTAAPAPAASPAGVPAPAAALPAAPSVAPSAPVSAPTTQKASASVNAEAPVAPPNAPAPAPVRKVVELREPAVKKIAPPASVESPAPPVNRQRCSSLLGKFSLGEELNAEDKRFLETSCR